MLCVRNLETLVHLIWECPIAIQVWNKAASWIGCQALVHGVESRGRTTDERVQIIIQKAPTSVRKGIKTMIALIAWQIWLEQCACTFKEKTASAHNIIQACRRDMEQWRIAGASCIEHPFGDVP